MPSTYESAPRDDPRSLNTSRNSPDEAKPPHTVCENGRHGALQAGNGHQPELPHSPRLMLREDRPKTRKHTNGKPKDQEDFTDPDSRIMKTSKGYQQSFNARIAVDGKSQWIVATKVTNSASDTPELVPMIELAMANTKQPVDRVLADAG